MLFTIRDSENDRIIAFYVVLAPEAINLLLTIFLSRWPDNPCQSLNHLIHVTASLLKSFLIIFIMLKLDNILQWSWTSTLW